MIFQVPHTLILPTCGPIRRAYGVTISTRGNYVTLEPKIVRLSSGVSIKIMERDLERLLHPVIWSKLCKLKVWLKEKKIYCHKSTMDNPSSPRCWWSGTKIDSPISVTVASGRVACPEVPLVGVASSMSHKIRFIALHWRCHSPTVSSPVPLPWVLSNPLWSRPHSGSHQSSVQSLVSAMNRYPQFPLEALVWTGGVPP